MSRGQLPRLLRRRRARRLVGVASKALTALDISLHRRGLRTIGGRVAHGPPVLLLHTTGRRSGRRRTTPLLYHRDADGSLLLVAANGGADWDPHWLHNLRADPHAEVELEAEATDRRRTVAVLASVLAGDERAGAWPDALAAFPGLDDAQRATTRPIQLVRLTPRPTP